MSNCIEIVDAHRMRVTGDRFDIARFRELCDRAEQEVSRGHNASGFNDGLDDERIVWWFLPRDNVTFGDDECWMHFGSGRSAHTNRDFKGLMRLLNKYFRPSRSP